MNPRLLFGFFIMCLFIGAAELRADLGLYTYNSNTEGTYTALTGGTTLGDQYSDDDVFEDLDIGFTFNFDGTDYETICVACNGFIGFGSSMTNMYSPIQDDWSGNENIVSILGGDLQAQANASLKIITTGTSPNRVCVIQWTNYRQYNYDGDSYNMQIKLYETSNRIEFCYGEFDPSDWFWYQTGMRTDNYDFRNYYVGYYDNSWEDIWEMDDVGYGMDLVYDMFPPEGLILSWEIEPFQYEYSMVYQFTNNVPKGANNQVILAVELGITGVAYPVSVSELTFNTTGTTNVGDITNAKLYFTGDSPNFNMDSQYGNTVNNPNGTFSFTGDLELKAGVFYFWLTYDISSTANTGNVVDAQCPNITVGAGDFEPDDFAPTGNRLITTPFNGTFTVGTGGNYPNLYSAFSDVNRNGMNGDITYNIISNITEPNPAELIQPGQSGDGGYSILVKPINGSWTISGNFTVPVVIINGAPDVTIDGSNSNSDSRNLTIVNSGTTAASSGAMAAVFATNFTAKNLTLASSARNIGYGILLNRVENGLVENNRIYRSNSGVYVTNESKEIEVSKNLIGSSTASDAVRAFGLYFYAGPATAHVGEYSCDGFHVHHNEINGLYNDESALAVIRGILMGDAINGIIEFNKIHNATNTASACYGTQISGYHTPFRDLNITFANNVITNLNATSSYISYLMPHSQSNTRYYHNTINANGQNSSNFVATVYMHNDIRSVRFYNNLLHHNQTGSTMHGINVITASNPFTKIDGNAYSLQKSGTYFGYISGTNYTNFGDWQTAIVGEKFAKVGNAAFTSDNIHLDGAAVLSFLVDPLEDVTTDWDGETRRTDKTNVGADEAIPFPGIQSDMTDLSGTVFCPGSSAEFTFIANIGSFADGITRTVDSPFDYKFFKDGVELKDEDTDNITINGNVLTIDNLLESRDRAFYSASAELMGNTMTSSERELRVETPMKITSQLNSRDVCVGDPNLVLSIKAEGTIYGTGDYKSMNGYQWQKEDELISGKFNNIPGENSNVYSLPLSDVNQARGNYRVLVLGPGNCGAAQLTSNIATVQVSEPLENIHQEITFDPTSVCDGETLEFKVLANGTIKGYQWQYSKDGFSFNDIDVNEYPTAATNTFVLENAELNQSGFYRATVFGSKDCNTEIGYSDKIEISVYPLFGILDHPKSTVVCQGEEVILNVVPDGVVLDVPDAYRWQKDGVFIDIKDNPTAHSPILIINSANYDQTGAYSCVIHYIDCRGIDYMTTHEAQVYVLRTTEFVHQPVSTMAQTGETAQFTFDAHINDYPPAYQPDVQWYRGTTALVDNNRIIGTKSSILSIRDIQTSDFGDDYYVIVTGKCGTAQSERFALAQTTTISFINQPLSLNVCETTDVQFQAVPDIQGTMNAPEYAWYKNDVKLADNARITGTDTETLSITNINAGDQGQYICHVSVKPANDLVVNAISNPAQLDVKLKPTITTGLAPTMLVETGKELKLEIVAESALAMTYQWMKDGADLAGETNTVLSIASATLSDAGIYTCRVSNECGSIMPQPCNVTVQLQGTTGVDPLAGGFGLFENTPNPFSNSTVIEYAVPYSTTVKLVLNDLYGREIAVLVNGSVPAGVNHVEVDASALKLTSGTYFYTLTANGFSATKQMMIVK